MAKAKAIETTARARKAALVLPTYSLKKVATGDTLNIQVLCEIYNKPAIDDKTGEQKVNKMGEPEFLHLIQVQDMDTDEVGEMVIPIIIYHAIEKLDVLEGRCFEMIKGKAEANKATKWEVYEIEAD